MTTDWLPPRIKPPNESAGYLGYYTRSYLGNIFDLVDLDGCWPAIWIYRKAKTRHFRFIEEKPTGQDLHDSQERTLRELAAEPNKQSYVIWGAEQLAADPPAFPLRVTRLGMASIMDVDKEFARPQFDRWLINGWAPINKILEMPYEPPEDWPDDLNYYDFDRAVTNLAVMLSGEEDGF